jgi:hypothetical protein
MSADGAGQTYAAELEERIRPHLRMSNGSWRVDETYVKVRVAGPICIELSTAAATPLTPGLAPWRAPPRSACHPRKKLFGDIVSASRK